MSNDATSWWKIADWLYEFPTTFLAYISFYNTSLSKEDVLHQWEQHCATECRNSSQQAKRKRNKNSKKSN